MSVRTFSRFCWRVFETEEVPEALNPRQAAAGYLARGPILCRYDVLSLLSVRATDGILSQFLLDLCNAVEYCMSVARALQKRSLWNKCSDKPCSSLVLVELAAPY